MKVLVVGATGVLGAEICAQLSKKGHKVRAVVRPTADPAKVDRLRSMGAELVTADLRDPKSLERACKGEEALITTASTTFSRQPGDTIETVDRDGQINLVDAAAKEHVRRFVYVSFSIDDPSPLRNAKRDVEKRLKESGLEYTILRPTYFMEIWLSPALGFDYANSKATIYGVGDKKLSWIAVPDVAAFAVAAVDHPAGKNQVIPLGGPEALSALEVVKVFERHSGKKFAVQNVPVTTLQAQHDAAQDSLQKSFAALCIRASKGDEVDMRKTSKTFGIRPTSVDEYARRVTTAPGAPFPAH